MILGQTVFEILEELILRRTKIFKAYPNSAKRSKNLSVQGQMAKCVQPNYLWAILFSQKLAYGHSGPTQQLVDILVFTEISVYMGGVQVSELEHLVGI